MPTGVKIKEIRQQRGLTQKQLGDMCGIADANIRKYENGKQNPKIETLQKIADALGVPVTELLNYNYDTIEGEKVRVYDLTDMESKQAVDTIKYIQKNIESSTGINPEYITLHLRKDEFSEDEIRDIERYIEFIKSKKIEWNKLGKTIEHIDTLSKEETTQKAKSPEIGDDYEPTI